MWVCNSHCCIVWLNQFNSQLANPQWAVRQSESPQPRNVLEHGVITGHAKSLRQPNARLAVDRPRGAHSLTHSAEPWLSGTMSNWADARMLILIKGRRVYQNQINFNQKLVSVTEQCECSCSLSLCWCRGWPHWCTLVCVETRPWCRCCWMPAPILTARSVLVKCFLLFWFPRWVKSTQCRIEYSTPLSDEYEDLRFCIWNSSPSVCFFPHCFHREGCVLHHVLCCIC